MTMKQARGDTDVELFAPDATDDCIDPFDKVRELGLQKNIAELESEGYTVITPSEYDDQGLCRRLLDTVLDISQRRSGIKPDLRNGTTHRESKMAGGEHIFYALLEDPVFEEALLNETALAVVTYLLGESCHLSSMTSMIRGPGTPALGLHSDMMLQPSPFPNHAQVANATYALTDYFPDGGSVCFWPQSHKLCRRPTNEEINDVARFKPVTAPAGSLIVWHGNTWHGSFERKAPGLRVNLIMYFSRCYLIPQESYRDKISPDALERNRDRPRFRRLVGLDHPYPFDREGPDYARFGEAQKRTAALYG